MGDVQPRELQTKAADWMRTDAMVALLPPQLKAVHEFYKKPPPKYEAPAHELRNAKDVFQVARSHAYGPEVRKLFNCSGRLHSIHLCCLPNSAEGRNRRLLQQAE